MDINILWGKLSLHLLRQKMFYARTYYQKNSPWRGQLILIVSAIIIIALAAGCATPCIKAADPQILFGTKLAFIKDGVTIREDVLVKLGTPAAQLEGDRILTYQFRVDSNGRWHLLTPRSSATTGFREWGPETCSLVLVFGADKILRKHSLVVSK